MLLSASGVATSQPLRNWSLLRLSNVIVIGPVVLALTFYHVSLCEQSNLPKVAKDAKASRPVTNMGVVALSSHITEQNYARWSVVQGCLTILVFMPNLFFAFVRTSCEWTLSVGDVNPVSKRRERIATDATLIAD